MTTEIRDGFYTSYNGKQYRIGKYNKNTLNLISNNPKDILNQFIDITHPNNPKNIYRKTVSREETGDVYHYTTYWIFKGYRVGLMHEEDWFNDDIKECQVIGGSYNLVKEYNFKMFMERGSYIGMVPKSELEIIVEKTFIPDYFER